MYNVCPCAICDKPMSFEALREGVYWEVCGTFEKFWKQFWGERSVQEVCFAHRACWKRTREPRRKLIRMCSDPRPKSLNQVA